MSGADSVVGNSGSPVPPSGGWPLLVLCPSENDHATKARPSVLHTWVSTAGGPLIAVPKSELNNWAGVDDSDGPVETWGDYGRACAVEGYIGPAP
ncbi:Imm21 family immunity protein [Nonomuraea sp. 10N515B]|uniref:Imm21 family immunity protein n=1 Tax=Nonomuraea sp. 10N515B TaxID=3457422 RepID=UPI003FCC3D8C